MRGLFKKQMNCVYCGKDFKARVTTQKFCSPRCSGDNSRKKYRSLNPAPYLASATTGAIHELLVSVDILRLGHPVFRALSASCPGDLAVLLNGKLIVIEVTTGYKTNTGKLCFAPHKTQKYDVIAIVEKNGTITYQPNLFIRTDLGAI